MSLITDQQEFEDIIARCRESETVAFDTEFIREKRYRPRLCLVQIGIRDLAVAIDPFEIDDLSSLHALLADDSVRKLVHAGQQDMEIFFADEIFGGQPTTPKNIFDTQIAAALLGRGDCIGYSKLVMEFVRVRLAKTQTFTDWSLRPLKKKQIEYALDDVIHLHPAYDKILGELEDEGRVEWVEEELRVYQNPFFYRKDPQMLYQRVKGAAKLSRKELAVLRALTAWREDAAADRDRPRNHIISDDILVELVKAKPTKMEALSNFRGVHPQLVKRHGRDILDSIRGSIDTREAELPPPLDKAPKDSSLTIVVDLIETFLKARAEGLRVSPGWLATRTELYALVRRKRSDAAKDPETEPRVASGWRHELVGKDIHGLLEGRYSLAIEPETGQVVVQARDVDGAS